MKQEARAPSEKRGGGQNTFSYYPGCALKSSAREYDISARLCCESLGIELRELADWTCCGASSAHATSDVLAVALPGKDLHAASEAGYPLVTACAMCFSRLKIAAHETADMATRTLAGDVSGNIVPVMHLLEVIDSRLASLVPNKGLAGLKVACFYGCLLVRPKAVAIDDAENPQVMDRLMRTIGAEPMPWAFKTECCGAGLPLARPDIVRRLSHRILLSAAAVGADCVAVACPECHANLDMHQAGMGGKHGGEVRVPVVYFTQLLGLSLGFSPYELHLDRHMVDPLPALSSKGLA
ncbi:MAG: CoB--CoM heterodisulfide reductase iron-sulfur subunit B family protein [Chloroflexi bacterium]|nr:CoB--CoM heterodisulfide reductase iron-sulfur subunit B family protein [Chloroflexota bacterium]